MLILIIVLILLLGGGGGYYGYGRWGYGGGAGIGLGTILLILLIAYPLPLKSSYCRVLELRDCRERGLHNQFRTETTLCFIAISAAARCNYLA